MTAWQPWSDDPLNKEGAAGVPGTPKEYCLHTLPEVFRLRDWWFFLLFLLASAITAPEGFAQSASQVTPQVEIPERGNGGWFALPGMPSAAPPPGAENIVLLLQEVSLEGMPSLGLDPSPLWEPLLGKEVSLVRLYALAAEIERLYLDAGYPMIRVVVPPQAFQREAALVKMRIIDGYIHEIDVSAVPLEIRYAVLAYLEPLRGMRGITRDSLERQVLLAGEVAGAALRSVVGPGTETGQIILVVSGKHRLVSVTQGYDNGLSEALGPHRATVSLSTQSIFGQGERIGLSASSHPKLDHRHRQSGINFSFPSGRNGVLVGLDYTLSKTQPRGIVSALEIESTYRRLSAWWSFPLVLRRVEKVVANISLERSHEVQDALDTRSTEDRLSVLRFSLSGSTCRYKPTCHWGRLTVSQGLDILGSRSPADAAGSQVTLSRQDAGNVFTTISFSGGISEPLSKSTRLTIAGGFHSSFSDSLLSSQQYGITSPDAVSGFNGGSISGDSGWWGRLAWSYTLRVARMRVSPYLYGAYGEVSIHRPTATEQSKTHAQSVGWGLRIKPLGAGWRVAPRLRLEYSYSQSNRPGDADRRDKVGGLNIVLEMLY